MADSAESADSGNGVGSAGSARVGAPAPWLRWLAAAALVTPLLRWVVLVHSVAPGQPWRTGCPHCGAPLAPPADLRRLLPGAQCGACGRPAGAPAYLLEPVTLAAATLVILTVVGGGWSPWAVVGLAGWAAMAVALTFIDIAVHRLPDRLTLPAAAWVLAWLGVAALTGGAGGAWVRAAAAAAVCGAGFAVFPVVLGSRGYGFGDAKLALGVGALLGWLGWTAVVAGLFLAFLASGLVAATLLLARRVTWRDALPFGPYLVAGTLTTLAWAGLS
jgi:leader peptidase (prepilin peptidase)/N-methyltransferase